MAESFPHYSVNKLVRRDAPHTKVKPHRRPDLSARVFNALASLLALVRLSLFTGCQGVSSNTSSQAPTTQLTVTPASIAVGSVVDGASGTASGTLTAQGGAVTVTAAATNNSAFTVSGLTLPTTIASGNSASFTVTFSPLTPGAETATLTFTSNAQDATTTATLTGTGAAASTHTVSLSWDASSSPNILGYNVYRAAYATSCGSFSKINTALVTGMLYTDSAVVNGKSYCYASTAVNTSNEESAYSDIVLNVQIPAN